MQSRLLQVDCVAWSPDGKLLACGGSAGRLVLLAPRTGQRARQVRDQLRRQFRAHFGCACPMLCSSANSGGHVRCWSLRLFIRVIVLALVFHVSSQSSLRWSFRGPVGIPVGARRSPWAPSSRVRGPRRATCLRSAGSPLRPCSRVAMLRSSFEEKSEPRGRLQVLQSLYN